MISIFAVGLSCAMANLLPIQVVVGKFSFEAIILVARKMRLKDHPEESNEQDEKEVACREITNCVAKSVISVAAFMIAIVLFNDADNKRAAHYCERC